MVSSALNHYHFHHRIPKVWDYFWFVFCSLKCVILIVPLLNVAVFIWVCKILIDLFARAIFIILFRSKCGWWKKKIEFVGVVRFAGYSFRKLKAFVFFVH